MATQPLNLFVTRDGLVSDFFSPARALLPTFTRGDSVLLRVHLLDKLSRRGNTGRPFAYTTLGDGEALKVGVGSLNLRPTDGTFTAFEVADTEQETAALAYNISAANLQTALNALTGVAAAGGVTVSSTSAFRYTVVWNTVGTKPQLSFDVGMLVPSSQALTAKLVNGAAGSHEVFTLTLVQGAAALCTDFTANVGPTVTPYVIGKTINVVVDLQDAVDGSWYAILTTASATKLSAALAYNCTAAEVTAAFQTAFATLQGHALTWTADVSPTGFSVWATGADTLPSDLFVSESTGIARELLSWATYYSGTLSLATDGIDTLLGSGDTVTTTLAVKIGTTETSSVAASVTIKADPLRAQNTVPNPVYDFTGADGIPSYLYIGYATDDVGTGFINGTSGAVPAGKTYRAEIVLHAIPSEPLTAGDFVGRWLQMRGTTGDTGATGAAGSVTQVAGQNPDGAGHVTLTAANVGAAPSSLTATVTAEIDRATAAEVALAAADTAENLRAIAAENLKIPLTQKAAALGVATLDADGLVPAAQLPISDITGDVSDALDAESIARAAADLAEAGTRAAADALLIPLTQKGAASGVVPLSAGSKIDLAYIPDTILGQVKFTGTFNATTAVATTDAGTPTLNPAVFTTKGDYYLVSTGGTFASIVFAVGDWLISVGTSWEKVDNTDAVTMVAGRTGAITITSADLADFDSAAQAALAAALATKPTATLDTDVTLAANSDTRVPSQKGIKAYVDALIASVSVTWASLTGKPAALTQIAALTFADDDIIQQKAGALTNRTIAQLKTDFGISGVDALQNKTAPTIAASAVTLDMASGATGLFAVALNSNATVTISNPPASGKVGRFSVEFTADGTLRTITWPASVVWAYGIIPTLTSTNTKRDLLDFVTYDGGTTYVGSIAAQSY